MTVSSQATDGSIILELVITCYTKCKTYHHIIAISPINPSGMNDQCWE